MFEFIALFANTPVKIEHNEKVDSYVKSDASDVRKYRAEFRGQLSKFEKRR